MATLAGTDSKLLDKDVSSPLSNSQSRVANIRSRILGSDAQIRNLETLGSVDAETGVDNSVLLLWQHLVGSQRVPRRADVLAKPPLQDRVVLSRVFNIGHFDGERAIVKLHAGGARVGCEGWMTICPLATI
jgi:hypothetical protein